MAKLTEVLDVDFVESVPKSTGGGRVGHDWTEVQQKLIANPGKWAAIAKVGKNNSNLTSKINKDWDGFKAASRVTPDDPDTRIVYAQFVG
jgi:hypothetical protein